MSMDDPNSGDNSTDDQLTGLGTVQPLESLGSAEVRIDVDATDTDDAGDDGSNE
jgi:hypothetical protein